MKYLIEYEHLKDELVTCEKTEWSFNKVKDTANKHNLELSDEDFKRLFKLQTFDKDIGWMMRVMSVYKMSLADVLVSYITF